MEEKYGRILAATDHTLLTPTATWEQIRALLDEAIKYKTASACIPQSYVDEAFSYVEAQGSDLPICTVIGFPNGYETTDAKMFMAEDAVMNGATEIDMVINLGYVKDKLFDLVQDEIEQVKDVVGDSILKVIVETSELTAQEKILLCEVVTNAKADFIKTSTGFTKSGATFADVSLFKQHIGKDVKIKASGGIKTLADAEKFLELGASRLGSSRIVRLVQAAQHK